MMGHQRAPLTGACGWRLIEQLRVYASKFGLISPIPSTQDDAIATNSVKFLTELATRSALSLPDFVRRFRGQSNTDGRPNKSLYEVPVPVNSSRHEVYHSWNKIVRVGVQPRWSNDKPHTQQHRPPNHNSAVIHGDAVRRHIGKGQRDGRYLVFDKRALSLWPELFISPIGVVDKAGGDTRMINDYSFPNMGSVNDFTDRSNFPSIAYNPPRDIARRIHVLRSEYANTEVLLMLGDVSGAFRHVPIHEDAVHSFVFMFDDYVIIDLSCGFGWCGSPAFYSLAGCVINDLYESTPVHDDTLTTLGGLRGNVWCDDHTCVEVNHETRCDDANIALRHAMATVLGPTAINDKKFTSWSTQNKALGLMWDTTAGTVSIPANKLDKATEQIVATLQSSHASKSDLNKLLGVFRHVATCFPSARALYQRLHVAAISTRPFGKYKLVPEVIEDLIWFQAVLAHRDRFNGIPVAQFASITTPTTHVYMDASGTGLCVLEPHQRQFIRVKYSRDEIQKIQRGMTAQSINVRELHSAVLAALHWGPSWQQQQSVHLVHVCLHIDNTSAVGWAASRLSRNKTAQLYNRLLSLAEFEYQLSFSAEHTQGKLNVMDDAGSRAWSKSHSLWQIWANMSCSWSQVEVQPPFDDLSAVWGQLSLAETSKTKYNSHWSQWTRFSKLMGWSPWLTTVGRSSSNKLMYFAIYLWKCGWNTGGDENQYSTIQSKLSSIMWFHRRYSDIDLIRSPQLRLVLQGVKRLSDSTRKKLPVTPAFLRLLRRSLNLDRPQERLVWGSILLAYFFLLRRSEYLMVGRNRAFYCLKAKDVFFTNSRGIPVAPESATAVTIGLSGAKNDQFGRGAWRTMHLSGDLSLCSVRALKHILQARRDLGVVNHSYLCVDLTAEKVSSALKATATRAGVEKSSPLKQRLISQNG
ncbi:hypothetical protein PHMEG_00026088 [Phytophthora megakarya]|uniref:Reverse transcriptase domain-containing protein n=1 Tax=Phytophthora megakarya TaxID=4795 RepID=A0A225VAE4_9STRA|nr:hypothetical protein PHMEG_00026088 [Phytophthora megakarya]